jgi:hypothetical protein
MVEMKCVSPVVEETSAVEEIVIGAKEISIVDCDDICDVDE